MIGVQFQNCYRLLKLVGNLIDITKIDTGHFSLNMKYCNIVRVIEAITLSVVEYAESKGINVIFDTDSEERFMLCDPNAIERIMLNLLSNSVKFIPEAGTISVGVEAGEEFVRISVKDTGVGISEDKLAVIFDRFEQADDLFTRKQEGSGIGLNLVKSLVEMHGGSISVHSQYHNGSEFIVELPVNIPSEDTEKVEEHIVKSFDDIVSQIQVEFSDIYFN